MADLKTRLSDEDVKIFLDSIENPKRKEDCLKVHKIMTDLSHSEAKMWGKAIVGYGNYHYKYESGREGDWFYCGFSPRKQALTIYIMTGFSHYDELLQNLGSFKTGKSCLYIKKWEDIDEDVLKKLISQSIAFLKERYP